MSAPSIHFLLASRLLEALVDDVLPLTEASVQQGNKVFGAALLNKSDYSTYLAETNNEMESPLHHGEMHLLKRYFEIPASERTAVKDLLFLTSHEPCSLCLSAITWSGFDNFYYFFSHEDSRDNFEIPHDLKILKEVFNVEPGKYVRSNEFWTCFDIQEWIASNSHSFNDQQLKEINNHIDLIKLRYEAASLNYQKNKTGNQIPLN